MNAAYSNEPGGTPGASREESGTPLHLAEAPFIIDDPLASLRSEGIELLASVPPAYSHILTAPAVRFVARLSRRHESERVRLLQRRKTVQDQLRQGHLPMFLPETELLRRSEWTVAPVPSDLSDRRVEITGPAGDTKMVINALNSGARVFMADFEDAQSPTWANSLCGQANLYAAVRRTISHTSPKGKVYRLHDSTATLMARPRGWHLEERHLLIDGRPVSAALFDFGLYVFHNTRALNDRGSGPYFYLPKLENHLEARLWNAVFSTAEEDLRISTGTIKATVLIETILAAFEMDEILFELRDRSAGLNCGRWDYIFSVIKKFSHDPRFLLPDRNLVTMESPFLSAYVNLLVQTCHRRGAHAMGGMAANIPIKSDDAAHANAMAKVRADKEREVTAGHDGTWVAHPALVQIAREVFDAGMPEPNQIHRRRAELNITGTDLLRMPAGQITEEGLRKNIDVGIRYLEAWLRGVGAVPLYHLMEDAATAEISRAQVWQAIHHRVVLTNGMHVTLGFVRSCMRQEIDAMISELGDEQFAHGRFTLAAALFDQLISAESFVEFLTVSAYDYL